MPRNATKAADNVFYLARKAAKKCNDHLGSREGARRKPALTVPAWPASRPGSSFPTPRKS